MRAGERARPLDERARQLCAHARRRCAALPARASGRAVRRAQRTSQVRRRFGSESRTHDGRSRVDSSSRERHHVVPVQASSKRSAFGLGHWLASPSLVPRAGGRITRLESPKHGLKRSLSCVEFRRHRRRRHGADGCVPGHRPRRRGDGRRDRGALAGCRVKGVVGGARVVPGPAAPLRPAASRSRAHAERASRRPVGCLRWSSRSPAPIRRRRQ